MLRSATPFPAEFDNIICSFMKKMWQEGWLDEYSSNHFLIKALEGRLENFSCKEQFINNNNDSIYTVIDKEGFIDYKNFCINFCTNLSARLHAMTYIFGENTVKKFIINQLSAGKDKYNEDFFFQALSEIEILTFVHHGFKWKDIKYEPSIGPNGSNPEAYFIGDLYNIGTQNKVEVKVNIEVKTPSFPNLSTHSEKYLIPTILLSDQGRKNIPNLCTENGIEFISPRVTKLVEFINSASKKFDYPKENEYNLLYINWAYCDFPSNAFLEAWSLLTNKYNGLLTCPEIAMNLPFREPVLQDAFKKITAVIVYTSSLEQLMFCDFRHVWQRNGAGCKFRMFVVDEKLRSLEFDNKSDLLFKITGMKPDIPEQISALFACNSKTHLESESNANLSNILSNLITDNALTQEKK